MSHANSLVEEQLDRFLEDLEKEVTGDVLALCSDIRYGIDDAVRDVIEKRASKRNKLVVVLETTGGYIEVTRRIVDTMRKHYSSVEFIIPNYAMSAGTVLVMSGDAIHMDYYSVLGPIDPQIEKNGVLVPAIGYLVQFKRLIEKSNEGKLSTAELTYLVERFDPAELYRYEQARELSRSLLREWLVQYKFKNWTETETRHRTVTQAMRTRRAFEVAKTLDDTERWHSHGRGISMEILRKDVRLLIDDFGLNAILNGKIRNYYKLLIDYMVKCRHRGILHMKDNYVPVAMVS